jgi:hypothetical protein
LPQSLASNAVWIGTAGLLAAALFFCHQYWPLRKWLRIKVDRSWAELARVEEFPRAAEEREALQLFVSSTVMRDQCDVVWRYGQRHPPAALLSPDLATGSVAHVEPRLLGRFIEEVLPGLAARIVLVSGCDTVSPNVARVRELAESPRVLHWFVQNFDLDEALVSRGRVTKLPLGLNFHKLDPDSDNRGFDMGFLSSPANQQLTLRAIRERVPPLAERPLRVYANFHLNMDTFLRSPEARKRRHARREALDALAGHALVDFEPRQIPRKECWRRHMRYAFEISPHGNGLDCHRTWEALLLKCIPIVKSSSLDSMYAGLPVAIVEDWREVTQARLLEWRERFRTAFDGPIAPELYSHYWVARFRRWQREAKSPSREPSRSREPAEQP